MEGSMLKLVGALAIVMFFSYAIMGSHASESFEKPTPKDPWFGQPFPPQPRPGFYKFLGDCMDKTTRECGLRVFDAIFNYKTIDDKHCCEKIVNATYLCNRSLQYTLAQFDKFKHDAAFISDRSNIVYKNCERVVGKRTVEN